MSKKVKKNEASLEKSQERKPFGAPIAVPIKPKYEVPQDLKPKVKRPKTSKIVIKE